MYKILKRLQSALAKRGVFLGELDGDLSILLDERKTAGKNFAAISVARSKK